MNLKQIVASVAVGATALVTSMGAVAHASGTSPVFTGYGFDGNAHLIVGGGSTTVYKLAQSLAQLWDDTASCATNNSNANSASNPESYPPGGAGSSAPTSSNAAFNQCLPAVQTYNGVFAGGNYDGDTVTIAAPTGSTDGIASINGDYKGTAGTYAYEGGNSNLPTTDTSPLSGYTNGYGTVDFGLSSRAATTSGGSCPLTGPTGGANDELACDTFWGIAADGVEIITFGTHAGLPGATGEELTAADIYNIYDCTYTNWDQIPNISPAYASAPIVPWGMNKSSGTYQDFINYEIANGGAPSSFTPNSYPCDRELSTGAQPLENDIKPLVNDAAQNADTYNANSVPAGLSTAASSVNNPSNWFWYGSYGLLSAFSYLSQYPYTGTGDGGSTYTVNTAPAPVNGYLPSAGSIESQRYPIPRVLNIVTTKADATCPLNGSNECDFTLAADGGPPTNGNGVTDINVEGATSGVGGAVREFLRFVCRDSASQEPTDPYTGVNTFTEIGEAQTASGFESIPSSLASTGSSCDVKSYG